MIRLALYSNLVESLSRIYFLKFLTGDTAIERGGTQDGKSYDEYCYACMCITDMEICSVFVDSYQDLFTFVYLEVLWER
jgi:hypothetical protein